MSEAEMIPLAEEAAEKAAPLAEEAAEKAAPLAKQAVRSVFASVKEAVGKAGQQITNTVAKSVSDGINTGIENATASVVNSIGTKNPPTTKAGDDEDTFDGKSDEDDENDALIGGSEYSTTRRPTKYKRKDPVNRDRTSGRFTSQKPGASGGAETRVAQWRFGLTVALVVLVVAFVVVALMGNRVPPAVGKVLGILAMAVNIPLIVTIYATRP